MESGTFGTPSTAQPTTGYLALESGSSLPNVTEQEIVVIDVAGPPPTQRMHGYTPGAGRAHWVKGLSGILDPRPFVMADHAATFDRIHEHGGVFVIFAAPKKTARAVIGHMEDGGLIPDRGEEEKASNWSFLTFLDQELCVATDQGTEMTATDSLPQFRSILRDFLGDATFHCTLGSPYLEMSWKALATNKYGAVVAALIEGKGREGPIIVLPHVRDTAAFLERLICEVLPKIAPRLFPDAEGTRWVERPEYELATVATLKRQIQEAEQEHQRKVADLRAAIQAEREANGFLHDLLRQTGRPLVLAVIKALKMLRFDSVVDVDLDCKDEKRRKREDLQILDVSPALLVEVKGISGLPTESDSLQAAKYVAPRMREWDRRDVQALAIVNHQRHLPALDRENARTFSPDVITNATEQKFGLMTTWDLFRLVTSFARSNWRAEWVRPLFYAHGRIEPTPLHYEFVGVFERYWDKAGVIGVRVQGADLSCGDPVGYELPGGFEEERVESLQVEKRAARTAKKSDLATVKSGLPSETAKRISRVYRIRPLPL